MQHKQENNNKLKPHLQGYRGTKVMKNYDTTQAVLNHHKLVRFCNEHGLILKATDYHFQYIVATKKGNVGVISCHISNNGKYYAHKTGKKNECYNDFFAARPAFETFDKALEHVTRHAVSQ